MAQAKIEESPLRARRRRRRALLATGLWALGMSVAIGLIALAHAPFMRVEAIAFEGSRTVAPEALEKSARQALEGRHFGLFPKDNIFLYPRERLAAAVLAAYPTLSDVAVQARNFTTLSIEAEDRVPRALWCGVAAEFSEPCLLLDEDGVAYAEAPEFSENPFHRYYGALASGALLRQFLAPAAFRPLAALVDALAAQVGEEVAGIAVNAEGDARLRFASGFTLIFALQSGGGDIFERFILALDAEPLKGRPLAEFEYLDLRFGDRLYYKVRD